MKNTVLSGGRSTISARSIYLFHAGGKTSQHPGISKGAANVDCLVSGDFIRNIFIARKKSKLFLCLHVLFRTIEAERFPGKLAKNLRNPIASREMIAYYGGDVILQYYKITRLQDNKIKAPLDLDMAGLRFS